MLSYIKKLTINDQIRIQFVMFSFISVILTFTFVSLTKSNQLISVQALSMPHFLIPLVFIFIQLNWKHLKLKLVPIIASFLLAGLFFKTFHRSVSLSLLAVDFATIYGLFHLSRDHFLIETFKSSNKIANNNKALLQKIIFGFLFLASAVNSIAFVHSNSYIFSIYKIITVWILVLCAVQAILIFRNRKENSFITMASDLYIVTLIFIWQILKAFVFNADFWDFFSYHVFFWYLFYGAYLFKRKKSQDTLKQGPSIRIFLTVCVLVNTVYLAGLFWGLDKNWLEPGPPAHMSGIFAAYQAPFIYALFYDYSFFYAWIVAHVTMSSFASPRRIQPALQET